jgi:transcriptional regulator
VVEGYSLTFVRIIGERIIPGRYRGKDADQMSGGSDLFTGTLDILILKSIAGGPRHGYAIGKWIRDQSSDLLQVGEGVLYVALRRLAKKGLTTATWGETETGRRARFHALTPAGRTVLADERARWNDYSRAVGALLNSPES